MNGARVDQRVVHVIPSAPAASRTSVAADREGEASLRLVGVDRERVPVNLISARSGAFQSDAHGVAADLRLAGRRVRRWDPSLGRELKAGSRFCVNESVNFVRGRCDRAADQGAA